MITLSPPSTQTPPPEPTGTEHGTESDPRIANLKGMFPDFDDAVILSVLESVNHDEERALDVLLGMNDPTYTSAAAAPPSAHSVQQQQHQPGLTQEDLDEQLARRLAFEEEQAAGAWSAQREPGWGNQLPQHPPQQQAGYQTYQPRRNGGRGWDSWNGSQGQAPQQQGHGGQRDTMAEFQDGFNKIAECEVFIEYIHPSTNCTLPSPYPAGKRTFNSIVSKVKAKMQEFDQGGGFGSGSSAAQAASGPNSQALGGSSAQDYGYAPTYGAGRTTNTSWSAGQPRTNTYAYAPPAVAPPVPIIDTHPNSYTRTPSPPAVRGYDLSDHDEDPPEHPTIPKDNSANLASERERVSGAAGGPPSSPTVSLPGAFPLISGTLASAPSPPSSSQRSGSGSGPGPVPVSSLAPNSGSQGSTGSAPRSNVDFSKLGLLPKRPVSLGRPLSPPATNTAPGGHASGSSAPARIRQESDDELEYVENPFEDRH
ncbi:hypothetical protein ID866_1395 [Astraeus odoratus]|nr:hypothetical protein ID866_1395 [Astraeus odoratus]